MIAYSPPILVTLFILLAGNPAWGQHHHTHGMGEGPGHGAHVHGVAQLFVVLQGQQLDIELHSPAMNLLGFEHRANSAEDRARVESAKASLADANSRFQIASARCQLTHHKLDFSSVVKNSGHGNEKHDTHHHDKAGSHHDIEAHYSYRCTQPDQLASLKTTIRTAFPGIQSLQVQWIVDGRQGAAILDNSQHHVIFR